MIVPEKIEVVPDGGGVVEDGFVRPAVAVAQKSRIRAASSPLQVVRSHWQTTSAVPAAMHFW